ncbi:carbohydrate ABC transporter permease [Ruania halotolerans]|uniref:carbohydrate ABC transporter permease n=1 Tax=Ruania halotolerans TaxID=2897773 RepID=UPI001E63C957|nr:sugar ABC transporter permease [Ruania halotolerans]UFU07970.1 sugar ABC transporter permease [Ruania halotolerans]
MSTAISTKAPPPRRRLAGHGLTEVALARLFIAPSVLVMAAVVLFPIGFALVTSLRSYTRRQVDGFAGLANYGTVLSDPAFWAAMRFTGLFTLTSVALEFVIGLAFALLMNHARRGRGVTRAVILVPWVIPTVVAGQMWAFMFNINPGFINSLLGLDDFNWLGSAGWATVTVIAADVWKTAPFAALLLLAGLQTIPSELYESARMDGASAWQRFWHLTLPLLRPAIMVALLFRTVDAVRVYDLPQVMTGGAFGTESLSMLVRQFIVITPDPGIGAALSTITFALVLGVGVLFVSQIGRSMVEGGSTR